MRFEDLTADQLPTNPKTAPDGFQPSLRTVLKILPVGLPGVAAAGFGVQMLRSKPAAPVIMLGGIATFPGGPTLIRGIIWLEFDHWHPSHRHPV